jgi:hypothetical protein
MRFQHGRETRHLVEKPADGPPLARFLRTSGEETRRAHIEKIFVRSFCSHIDLPSAQVVAGASP